jgi:tripartite-type tricarboxylate transporter receptor subunit TctC
MNLANTLRATLAAAGLVTTLLTGSIAAAADAYPTRPISLIVPFAAGGPGSRAGSLHV